MSANIANLIMLIHTPFNVILIDDDRPTLIEFI